MWPIHELETHFGEQYCDIILSTEHNLVHKLLEKLSLSK